MKPPQNVQIDLLLKVTTLIICKEGRKSIGTGTGFFFEDNQKFFLITNRHVVVDEKKNFYPDRIVIRLNTNAADLTDSKELSYNLYEGDIPIWKQISDQIDLVALEISKPLGVIFAALNKSNLLPDDIQLGLGEQVLVVGYPKGFYDEIHNLPIVRSASIASAYGVPFRRNPFFLVDSSLHPGTSGSPVITVPKNIQIKKDGSFEIGGNQKWHFLGVNSGEFSEMQLNAIWYAYLIVELLENK